MDTHTSTIAEHTYHAPHPAPTHPSPDALSTRLLIIGPNAPENGALAERLATCTSQPVIDLHHTHWPADDHRARTTLATIAAGPCWIMHAANLHLPETALPRATALLWIDPPNPHHNRLYQSFPREKARLSSLSDIDALVASLAAAIFN